jgi:hypothetical protein
MFYKVIYINLFYYYYNLIKNTKTLTKLLMSNLLSNKLKDRILIMSYFFKIGYSHNLLAKINSKYEGYVLRQSIVDKYTFAILKDGIIVIDYDNKELSITDIKKSLDLFPYTYDIVKSAGGYHIFITSNFFKLRSINTLRIMCSFKGSDPLFPFFTYMLGTTNLRMCKKETENLNEPIYKFIESYSSLFAKNNKIKPIKRIHQVVLDHIKEAEQYSNIIVKEKENSRTIILERKFIELENEPNSLLDPKNKYAEVNYNIQDNLNLNLNDTQDILKYIESKKELYPVTLSKHYVPYDYI